MDRYSCSSERGGVVGTALLDFPEQELPTAKSLEGRVAVVTGASRGIGRAVCESLRGAGAYVVGVAQSRLSDDADRSLIVDVSQADAAAEIVADVLEIDGRVDILVNCAGVLEPGTITRLGYDAWQRMVGVNLTGTLMLMQATLPQMVERGWGRIINIASVVGRTGDKFLAGYAATKHGVLGLTRSAALEVAEHGVTCNAVCPGVVATDMTDRAIQQVAACSGRTEQLARRMLVAGSPQKRLFQPSEVAAIIAFLASDAAAGINGQAINLCGGAVLS